MLSRLAAELLTDSILSRVLRHGVRTAVDAKLALDRNVETVLAFLNLPSRGELIRLQTKLEVIQGSLVNLNIKVDRLLAARNEDEPPARPLRRTGE